MSCLRTSIESHDSVEFVLPELPTAVVTALNRKVDAIKARVAEEFIEFATMLQTNSQSARQITNASLQVTGAQTSQISSRCISMLQSVLADTMSITEMVATSTQKISQILFHIQGVTAPLRRLTKMSTLLHIVSMFCRIEAGKNQYECCRYRQPIP